MSQEPLFWSPSAGRLSKKQLINQINTFISSDPKTFYRLVIGTDSQVKAQNGSKYCDFVSALVIHRNGQGARYFVQKTRHEGTLVLRDRIYQETTLSLTLAHSLVPELRKAFASYKYDLEIHIDVGERGETREMIKEVVGMVNGNGFVAKTKPNSWGASSVADKHT
jgi:uncharacterized protein